MPDDRQEPPLPRPHPASHCRKCRRQHSGVLSWQRRGLQACMNYTLSRGSASLPKACTSRDCDIRQDVRSAWPHLSAGRPIQRVSRHAAAADSRAVRACCATFGSALQHITRAGAVKMGPAGRKSEAVAPDGGHQMALMCSSTRSPARLAAPEGPAGRRKAATRQLWMSGQHCGTGCCCGGACSPRRGTPSPAGRRPARA